MVVSSKASDFVSFIQTGRKTEVEFLLNSKSVDCDSILCSSNKKPLISSAVETGNAEIVKLLCRHDCNVRLSDNVGITPLHIAVANGYTEIVRILLSYGADVNVANIYTQVTPLHLAAERIGNTDILELLLVHNPNLNAFDLQGQTPFMKSCFYGHGDKAALLLNHGCNPLLKDKSGNTGFSLATTYPSVNGSFLNSILTNLKNENIRKIIINEISNDGDRPIHSIAKNRSYQKISALKILLQHGADVNLKNWTGQSALEMAVIKKDVETVRNLLISGIAVSNSAFEYAVDRNQIQILELLRKAGFKLPSIKDNSPLWSRCSQEIKDWLKLQINSPPESLLFIVRESIAKYKRNSRLNNPLDINQSLHIPISLIQYLNYLD